MKQTTIQTAYQSTAKTEPKTVYWLASLDTYFGAGSSLRSVARDLAEYLERIKNLTVSSIVFEAVTVAEWDYSVCNRVQHCGFRHHTTERVDPIIVRGVELPEIKAKFSRYWVEEKKGFDVSIYFQCDTYGESLTDGQRDKLKEWFGPALVAAATEKLLEDLKDREIKRAKAYTAKRLEEAIDTLQGELKKIEKL